MSASKEYKPTHGGYPGQVIASVVTPRTVLEGALKLLSDPSKWTKGASQRSKFGTPCDAEEAVCFCTMGALNYSGRGKVLNEAYTAVYAALPPEAGGSIANFNDAPQTKHEDVLNLLRKAIEVEGAPS